MLENPKKDFPVRTSVGIWYFTPGGGRFYDHFVKEASVPGSESMVFAEAVNYCFDMRLYSSVVYGNWYRKEGTPFKIAS